MPLCDDVRASLSAMLDGEEPVLEEATVDLHVARCGSCERFATGLPTLARRTRVTDAPPVPDLRAPIVAAWAAGRAAERGDDRAVLGQRRAVAALAGVVQLVVAVPTLLGSSSAGHLAQDLAASEAALAAVFLLAAWRPAQARPLAAVATLFAAIGALAAGAAIVEGGALIAEVTHLVPVLGAAVLWSLIPFASGPSGPPARPAPGHR